MSNSKTKQEGLRSRLKKDLPKQPAKNYPYNPYKWQYKFQKNLDYLTRTGVIKKRNEVRIMAQKEIDSTTYRFSCDECGRETTINEKMEIICCSKDCGGMMFPCEPEEAK